MSRKPDTKNSYVKTHLFIISPRGCPSMIPLIVGPRDQVERPLRMADPPDGVSAAQALFLSMHSPLPCPSSPFMGMRGSHLLKPLRFCAEGFSGLLWHPVPVSWKVFRVAFANTTAFENTVMGFQIRSCDCSLVLLKMSSLTHRGARELRSVKWVPKTARHLLRGSWKSLHVLFWWRVLMTTIILFTQMSNYKIWLYLGSLLSKD